MKILIAEDEEFSRQLLEGQLENLGHEVVSVASGVEAWSLLQREEFPLLITDWMMPELDGLELVRRIRSRAGSNYVYVILLTAKSDQRDVVRGIMEGADDFLTKPYDRDELNVRIRAGERVIDLERRLSARNDELAKSKLIVEQANQRMKNDLDAAARIQRSLLPTATPDINSIDFAWVFRPCDELAGDIFNVFQLDREHIAFYMLDVVGHGVPAALLSVTLSRFLSSLAGSSDHRLLSPDELATELNRRFPMNERNEQYFTLLYGCLHLETRVLRYVSAGHPGPVHMPVDGAARILEVAGYPIGIVEEPGYVEHCLSLSPGDRIFLYSDGLLDAENPMGACFGKEGLMDCIAQRRDSLHDQVRLLEERVGSWCDGQSPKDDISVLAMSLLQDQ
jgi:sigma-B regulation protein RsbU (phosphoserine phosphatase)